MFSSMVQWRFLLICSEIFLISPDSMYPLAA